MDRFRSEAIRPMTVGEIIDRSLRISPKMFKKYLPLFAIISIFNSFTDTSLPKTYPFVMIALFFIWIPFAIFLYYGIVILSGEMWRGKDLTWREVKSRISFKLVLKVLSLTIRVSFIGGLGLFLLIIPGLIYFLNRSLAFYILIIEDCTVNEAIEKSKRLMTEEKWYSFSGPYTRITALFLVGMLPQFFVGVLIGLSGVENISSTAGHVGSFALLIVAYLFNQFFTCFTNVCFVGFYYDLSARYEGIDIVSDLQSIRQPNKSMSIDSEDGWHRP